MGGKVKHGIICPEKYLEQFAGRSDFHLILPHLYESNPGYYEYYKDRISKGDFVTQDNSIFELEHSLDYKHLLEVGEKLGVSEIVGPEVLNSAADSKKLMYEFLDFREQEGSTIPVLAVAQGANLKELVDTFFEYNSDSRISALGLPFDLEHQVPYYAYVRSLTLRRVLSRWFLVDYLHVEAAAMGIKIKPTHLLGLADGVELQAYSVYNWVRSNDSSSAFVHGLNDIRYTDRGLPTEKIKEKLDFSMSVNLTQDQINNIDYNISSILKFIQDV